MTVEAGRKKRRRGEADSPPLPAPSRGRTRGDKAEADGGYERSLATREKLLDAATEGFARVGYDGYSNRMVEQASGVHHALIGYHFGSKLGLWKACMMRMTDDNRQRSASLMAEARDDTARLRVWMEQYIRNTARHPEFQIMAVDAAGCHDERFQWLLETLGRRAHDTALELIRSAQKAGTFVPGDPGILLNSFLGAAVRIYVMAAETKNNIGRNPFDPGFIDDHVRTLQSLFFRD